MQSNITELSISKPSDLKAGQVFVRAGADSDTEIRILAIAEHWVMAIRNKGKMGAFAYKDTHFVEIFIKASYYKLKPENGHFRQPQ